jgi:hypothetical protein
MYYKNVLNLEAVSFWLHQKFKAKAKGQQQIKCSEEEVFRQKLLKVN